MPALASLLPTLIGMLKGGDSSPAPAAPMPQYIPPPQGLGIAGDVALAVGGLAVLGVVYALVKD